MLVLRAMTVGAMRFCFSAALSLCAPLAAGCAGMASGVTGIVGTTLFEADFMRDWMCSGILAAAKGVPSSPSEKCTRLQYPAHAYAS